MEVSMRVKRIDEADFASTGYSYTLSLITGKYKPIILYCLMEYEPVRFNEMQRYLGRIADKTLSQHLKELERDGLIHREMYPEVPPRVEYTLTERGHSLMKVLDQLCDWGNANRVWYGSWHTRTLIQKAELWTRSFYDILSMLSEGKRESISL